jgi:hypothetical protein
MQDDHVERLGQHARSLVRRDHDDFRVRLEPLDQAAAHRGPGLGQRQPSGHIGYAVGMQRLAAAIVQHGGGAARDIARDGVGKPRIVHVAMTGIHIDRMITVVIRDPVFHRGVTAG